MSAIGRANILNKQQFGEFLREEIFAGGLAPQRIVEFTFELRPNGADLPDAFADEIRTMLRYMGYSYVVGIEPQQPHTIYIANAMSC